MAIRKTVKTMGNCSKKASKAARNVLMVNVLMPCYMPHLHIPLVCKLP